MKFKRVAVLYLLKIFQDMLENDPLTIIVLLLPAES